MREDKKIGKQLQLKQCVSTTAIWTFLNLHSPLKNNNKKKMQSPEGHLANELLFQWLLACPWPQRPHTTKWEEPHHLQGRWLPARFPQLADTFLKGLNSLIKNIYPSLPHGLFSFILLRQWQAVLCTGDWSLASSESQGCLNAFSCWHYPRQNFSIKQYHHVGITQQLRKRCMTL